MALHIEAPVEHEHTQQGTVNHPVQGTYRETADVTQPDAFFLPLFLLHIANLIKKQRPRNFAGPFYGTLSSDIRRLENVKNT